MKRLLSLALACVLAVGMTATSFAEPPAGFNTSSASMSVSTPASTLSSLTGGQTVSVTIPRALFKEAESGAFTMAEAKAYIRLVTVTGHSGVFGAPTTDNITVGESALYLTLTVAPNPSPQSGKAVVKITSNAGTEASCTFDYTVPAPAPEPEPTPEPTPTTPVAPTQPTTPPASTNEGGGNVTSTPNPGVQHPGSDNGQGGNTTSTPNPGVQHPGSNNGQGGNTTSTPNPGVQQPGDNGQGGNTTSTPNPGVQQPGDNGQGGNVTSPPNPGGQQPGNNNGQTGSSNEASQGSSSQGGDDSSSQGSSSSSSDEESSSSSSSADESSKDEGESSSVVQGAGQPLDNNRQPANDPPQVTGPTQYDPVDGFAQGVSLRGPGSATISAKGRVELGIPAEMFTYTYGGEAGKGYISGTHPSTVSAANLGGVYARVDVADGSDAFSAYRSGNSVVVEPRDSVKTGQTYTMQVYLVMDNGSKESARETLTVTVPAVPDSIEAGSQALEGGNKLDVAVASGREFGRWTVDIGKLNLYLDNVRYSTVGMFSDAVLNQLDIVLTSTSSTQSRSVQSLDALFDAKLVNTGPTVQLVLEVKSGLDTAVPFSGNVRIGMKGSTTAPVAISGVVGANGVLAASLDNITGFNNSVVTKYDSEAPKQNDKILTGATYVTLKLNKDDFAGAGITDINADLAKALSVKFASSSVAGYFQAPAFNYVHHVTDPVIEMTLNVHPNATLKNDIVLGSTFQLILQKGATSIPSSPLNLRGTIAVANSTAPVSGSKIDGFSNTVWLSNMVMHLNGKDMGGNLSGLDLNPDDEIRIYLRAGLFHWTGDNQPGPNYAVSESQLRAGKVTVRKSASKGSNLIDAVEFKTDRSGGGTYIRVKFVERFVSTSEKDVELKVYLSQNGKRNTDYQVDIDGTMANEEIEVDSGDDYVDTSDGVYVYANDYVRNITMYLGNGVHVTTNMFRNQKYYGVAYTEMDEGDLRILDAYPEIDIVLTLKTVNVRTGGTPVELDYRGYYVYDSSGKYLGRSEEKLAFSDKYYLATKRLSFSTGYGNVIEEEGYGNGGSGSGAGSGSGSGSSTGGTGDGLVTPSGGADATSNKNNNPYTGR